MTTTELDTNNDKHLHVLHVVSGDLWAGAEVMLYVLAKSLHTELKTRVTVVILNKGTLEQKLRACGVNVIVLDESQLNGVQIFQQLCKIIAERQPDVLHSHRNKENILGSMAAYRYGVPSLRTEHGASEHSPPLYQLPKRLFILLNRLCGRFLQRYIVAVSADLANKLKHDYPRPRIKIIENGIDIDTLLANLERTPEDNEAGHSSQKPHRIGIAGRLTPVKRVDIFINAALYLKRQYPELDVHFHIYGSGPLQETLNAQVNAAQANAYIHFEGHTENIPQHLLTLDALLMTSDHEGLPMILLEAMCTKTPIIAHAVGGIPDLLQQGKCGTLVHNHTPQAFANAIAERIQTPLPHQQRANLAFEQVKQNNSAYHTGKAYKSLYHSLIQD